MKAQPNEGKAQPDPTAQAQTEAVPPNQGAYAPYYQYGHNNNNNAGFPQPQPPQPCYYPEAQPAPAQYQAQYYPPQPPQDYPEEATGVPQPAQGHPLYYAPPNTQNTQNAQNTPQVAARAPDPAPAYYDYTAPQTYQEVRKYEGANEWATGMWNSPCKEPGMCLASFFCPCCCTFLQRRKLLVNDWKNYRCCAGTCAYACCSCFNNNNCGGGAPFCLAMETLFCLPCAVHANRYMVMRHYGLRNECCDLVLMWSACVCQIVSAIIGDGCLNSIADIWYYIVMSCMLAQHEHQMKKFPYPTQAVMN